MKRGVLVLQSYVEDGEALFTRALLKRAGLEIVTARTDLFNDIVTQYDLKIQSDMRLEEVDVSKFDFIVIPGGKHVGLTIDSDTEITKIIKAFYKQNKLVSAICAAPRFLDKAGVLADKNYTCFPSLEKTINTGKYDSKAKVVLDGNIITSRSAGTVLEFSYEIVKYLLGHEKADLLLESVALK